MNREPMKEKGEELSLREIQLELVKLLSRFDAFCRANQLRYTLAYGSVLGAVRHAGFIPWDDDLDLYMLRDDYERLIDLLEAGGDDFTTGHSYICERNSKCPFLKIMSKEFIAEDPAMSDYDDIGITSLWLDVFPLDAVPCDPSMRMRQFNRSGRYQNLYFYSRTKSGATLNSPIRKLKRHVARLMGTRAIISRMHKFAQGGCGDDAGLVADLIWGDAAMDEYLHVDDITQPSFIAFETGQYPVPKDYRSYLARTYGDYMRIPDEEHRITHGIRCWRAEVKAGGGE